MKYLFMHIPKVAGCSIRSALPEQKWHNGPFAEGYNLEYQYRPPSAWPNLNKYTGEFYKEAGQDLVTTIKEKGYADSIDHFTLEQMFEVKLFSSEEFNKYFSFCFVRNPWDRLLSIYTAQYHDAYTTMITVDTNNKTTREEFFDKIMSVDNFSFWVTKILKQINGTTPEWFYKKTNKVNVFNSTHNFSFNNHLAPQHLYAFAEQLNKKVNFVGRYENIEDDFKVVAEELGLGNNTSLPHINSFRSERKGKHYAEFYTKEARDVVAEIYADDIKIFGYEFEK